jgi:hypothetical protein
MSVVAIILGVLIVLAVLADLVNTLVTTTTSSWRWWLTTIIYRRTWSLTQRIGRRITNDRHRERFYSIYAPLTVLGMLFAWVTQQIVGFGLIWWGLGGVDGVSSLLDAIYYSGVVFFTVGFGEVVPAGQVPRFGALIEAFTGVLTTALVIGYLPALYSAYSEREQKLLTLDDGTEGRITPTNLVLSRCPDGNLERMDGFLPDWELWVAQVMETHTTFPMLSLFRSQHPGQSWITALGLVTDAALHLELVDRPPGGSSYWMYRRSARLLQMLTQGADLSEYRKQLDEGYEGDPVVFRELYDAMTDHGFSMVPFDEAVERSQAIRRTFDAQLEYLIDILDAPRGFWGHVVGHTMDAATTIEGGPERWTGLRRD